MSVDRLLPWMLRAAWAALPFIAGPALADGMHDWTPAVRTTASIGLWFGWALGLVATLVAHPVSLSAMRVLAPIGVVASVAAAVTGSRWAVGGGWWLVVLGLVFWPETGVQWVNGPAYPNERRFPLRAPGLLLVGPLALAWMLAVAGPVAAPLLLAAEQWVGGAIALVLGGVLSAVFLRAIHGLSRRWIVFVPAGVVVHDPLGLTDPVLFPRPTIERFGAAEEGTDALDLSQRAPGLTLELRLLEPASLALTRPGNRIGETVTTTAVLVTPTRPGRVLAEARARRIP